MDCKHQYGKDLELDLINLYGDGYKEIDESRFKLWQKAIDISLNIKSIIQNPIPISESNYKEWLRLVDGEKDDISKNEMKVIEEIKIFVEKYHLIKINNDWTEKEELIREVEDIKIEIDKLQQKQDVIKEKILEIPNKSLEEEFDDWLKYSKKINYSYVIDKEKAPWIRSISDDWMERYQILDIDMILETIEDECIVSPEELMREMIDLNFGSMVYDW